MNVLFSWEISSCYQLISVVCVSTTDLHVCSLEWLDHPDVPVPRSPPALLELPHCQVIFLSLIYSHQHLLGSLNTSAW